MSIALLSKAAAPWYPCRMPQNNLLQEFHPPDYQGGSVLNLLASLIEAHGGSSPHAPARALPAKRLTDATTLIYLLVDGVGEEQLSEFVAGDHGEHFFAAHPRQTLTTVYPATTAAAVTTFGTGASPTEHGIIGWHLHLADLGIVSSILPAQTRTDSPLAAAEFDLGAYLALPSHLNTARRKRVCLSYGDIPTSRYSRAGTQWHATGSYATLDEMVQATATLAARREPALAYVYWPEYDTLCHENGTDHPTTQAHLDRVDEALARLVEGLQGLDAHLVVTADHGLVNAPLHLRINLAALPGFYECLATVPAGDARSVHCFVRPRMEQAFLEIVEKRLASVCICLPGEEMLRLGVFGPGREHPALRRRIGDYVLLARGDAAFSAPIWGQDGACFTGNHGGMSRREMVVPLYSIPPG